MRAKIAKRLFTLLGWRLEGSVPDIAKCVIIAAPHTSNWDVPFALLLTTAFGLKINFMMKHTMFRPPFGFVWRALGGIPIDRRARHNVVEQSVARFRSSARLMLIIPPEGTRSKVTRWKTGFYHIAHGADVPILLGFLDFKRKVGGFGPLIHTTGVIEDDMQPIKRFYAGITGKHPQDFGEITI